MTFASHGTCSVLAHRATNAGTARRREHAVARLYPGKIALKSVTHCAPLRALRIFDYETATVCPFSPSIFFNFLLDFEMNQSRCPEL